MDAKQDKSARRPGILLYDFRPMDKRFPWRSRMIGLDPVTFGYMTSHTILAPVSPLVLRTMLNPTGLRTAGGWCTSRAVKDPRPCSLRNSMTPGKDNRLWRQDFVGRGIGRLMESSFSIVKMNQPRVAIFGSCGLIANRSLIRFSKLSSTNHTLNSRPTDGGWCTFPTRQATTSSMWPVSITHERAGAFPRPAPLNLAGDAMAKSYSTLQGTRA